MQTPSTSRGSRTLLFGGDFANDAVIPKKRKREGVVATEQKSKSGEDNPSSPLGGVWEL